MFYMDIKLSLLCFHLFLVLSYLLYQVSMFLKLHNTTNCFKFWESFAAFWTSKKFQQWSFQKNSRKIIIKISTSGETQRGLGPARGPPVAQAASWRGPAPGRAHRAPGAHRAPLQVCLLPPSLSFSKNSSSALVLVFLLFLEAILRSLSTAHHLSWNFEQILPGMWLLHPSN